MESLKDVIQIFIEPLKKFPIAGILIGIGLFLIALHFNGAQYDLHNIALYTGFGLLFFSPIFQYAYSKYNKYSEDDIECVKPGVGYGFVEAILRKYVEKDKFQFLAIYEGGFQIEVFSKSEVSGDTYSKKNNIFDVMLVNSAKCTKELVAILYHNERNQTTANVLRFVYDIHPGGAFVIGDCNIPNKDIYVFGYTSHQNNVNDCANKLGDIIDDIRSNDKYGNLPKISKINDDKK
jgi:hypothetical protein